MIKDKNKEVYTSPQTEALVVWFDCNIMQSSPQWGDPNNPGSIGNEDPGHSFGF